MQRPSSVSAIKVEGRRSHDRVRAGEDVDLAGAAGGRGGVRRPRRAPEPALGALDLDVVVTCSSGTYIRALARDLGEALGVGGHLTALRRTRVGCFDLGPGAHPRAAGRGVSTSPTWPPWRARPSRR